MKTSTLVRPGLLLLTTLIIAGCGQSKSGGEAAAPAMPQTQNALSSAADEAKKAAGEAASTVAATAKATASDIGSKFLALAKTQGDNVLSSIGSDLAAKAKSLADSCRGNPAVQTNLNVTVASLAEGKDKEALAPAFQLPQGPGLTTGQVQLAKEIGNLASAFVVQRNFSTLEGAQGDVASLVNSLRAGQYSAALPPLQKIIGSANLTPVQRDLIGSIADKYAPSLKQAAGSVQQGLQKLQALPGLGK